MGKSSTKYIPLDLDRSTATSVDKDQQGAIFVAAALQSTKLTTTASPKQDVPHAAQRAPSSTHILDPYARPYIPHALKYINELPGEVFATPALRRNDYDAYVSAHVGTAFLPAIPPSSIISVPEGFVLDDDSVHILYESYFRHHIDAEIKAQRNENDSHALYEHDATTTLLATEDIECSFFVPGLRENSPYIEEGDTIELRQLVYQVGDRWHTRPGQTLCYDPYLHRAVPQPSMSSENWTWRVFLSKVVAVQRKEERLTVRIDKSSAHLVVFDILNTIGNTVHCKFNIQFPVIKKRYLGMQFVLPVIQNALRVTTKRSLKLKEFQFLRNGSQNASPEPNAISLRNWLQSMLHPVDEDCFVQSSLNNASFNREYFDTALNREQQKAIESVCVQDYGPVPFLISGPPGTGKTKTLVEIALQLKKSTGVCRILFCAPSDPAADTLVQRLSENCKIGELLRLNRISRTFAEVPGSVLPFCSIKNNEFTLPDFAQILQYKIIVTTTRDATMLMCARLSNTDLYASENGLINALHPCRPTPSKVELYWTALLLDEAAQAIEPEVLVPLSIVAPPMGVTNLAFTPLFAMAGDEYQLGPRLARTDTPLKTSLFARLFARPVYSEHTLARGKTGKNPPALERKMLPILRPAFANLMANYRSHPAILAVPSNLFYHDTLENHAVDTNRLISWQGWKGRKWPVLFYNSSGEAEDELEVDGGGWYNMVEAKIACDFAQSIMATWTVKQEQICIMSPFKAQVKCLRNMIRQPQYGTLRGIDIGPTEVFQGLERDVVILCTTRTKERFVSRDQEQGWGIIGTPNKLNVALTRAKIGLIVIGKKETLECDENWRSFMSFCARNDLWDGKAYDWEEGGELNRLEKVMLNAEIGAMDDREKRSLKVWDRGESGMGDEAMWVDGLRAEEDDMGSSDDEDADYTQNGEESASSVSQVNGEQNLFEAEDDGDEYHEESTLDMTGLRAYL